MLHFQHGDKFAFEVVLLGPTPRKAHATPMTGSSTKNLDLNSVQEKKKKNCKFTYVFPSQRCFTALAINVGDCMQSCQQNPFLGWTTTDIHPARKTNPQRPSRREKHQPKYKLTTELSAEYTYTLLNK